MQDHAHIIFLLSSPQHDPWPYRPGQPTPRTGLPEERRGSLHSFRQMDKSAEHTQPSDCEQAHMMAHKLACLNTFMYAYRASSQSDEATHCTDSENVIKCPLFCCTDDRENTKCILYLFFALSFLVQHTNASIKVQMCMKVCALYFLNILSWFILNISKC